jgi:putative transposase
MIIPPKYKVSGVISRMKAQTASGLRKKFFWLSQVYWKENIVWSPGYFVSTIGLDEKTILEYIKWQQIQRI